MSTDSGIPDLAGMSFILGEEKDFSGGIFGMLNSTFAKKNPKLFYLLYRKTFFHPNAEPNACHLFLSDLEKQKKLLGIATMNIDFLHQKAGSKSVHEYWGNMRMNHCSLCNKSFDWDIAQQNDIPLCDLCGHVILPDFVLRNLGTYQDNIRDGSNILSKADLMIIAGTKNSWRNFPESTPKVIVNLELPEINESNSLFIQENIAKVFTDVKKVLIHTPIV
ncbi:Sir2 family NAD-dependent protein deacetylase [Enterococcus rivorum]|nr:Sir2 family NAD-dependent protein deacetylase [Enterococcus rivorum]